MPLRPVTSTVIVVLAIATGCQQSQTTSDDSNVKQISTANQKQNQDPKQIAIAAKDALFKKLSGRLMEAMSNGGPAAAIEVCGLEAPKIAQLISEEHGVKIGRTSFKLRNRKNAPPSRAKDIVENRTDEPTFVELDEYRLGAMLPIHLKSQCLACHGDKEFIAGDVIADLAKRYPDDQATGFKEGNLRGWFWVEVGESAGCCQSGNSACSKDGEKCELCAKAGGEVDSAEDQASGPPFGRGRGIGRGHRKDPKFAEDHNVFFFLLDHRNDIRRTIKNFPNGIETVTESDKPEVAAKIQEHVAAMYDRVENVNPIHMRDPLFREIFAHAKEIKMEMEDTEKGIRVTETSDDAYVVNLLQEHAKVVSLFIKNGRSELNRNHPVPERTDDEATGENQSESKTVERDGWQSLPTVAFAPDDNPTTIAKVELGKKLFFDPRLSLTGTVSCNSCHNVMEGGDDGRPTSMGIHGRQGPRNAPTVWNSVFQTSQFWDGRAATLEEQAGGPIIAEPEMGMPNHDVAVNRIKSIPGYVSEFHSVFGRDKSITIDQVVKAIAAFERTLITPNSPYDRYVQGEESAMTAQQIRGMKLFDSVGCTECHFSPNFNNWERGVSSIAFEEFPRSKGHPLVEKFLLAEDRGRAEVTKNQSDEHYFKVPTLRNITLTAPYFHNGGVPTLRQAVQVMSLVQLDTELSNEELDDLVTFLLALEGEFPDIVLPRTPSWEGTSVIDVTPADKQNALIDSSKPSK